VVASARPKARRRGARTRLRRPLRRQCDDRQITADTDTDLEWVAQGAPPATDATGEIDYGHIDPMTWGSGLYELQGYWGERRVRAPAARVVFEDSSLRAWGGLMVEGADGRKSERRAAGEVGWVLARTDCLGVARSEGLRRHHAGPPRT